MSRFTGILLLSLAALAPSWALAAAQAFGTYGDAQSAIVPAAGARLKDGQRVAVGSTVSTGPGGRVALRFDDGLELALAEESAIRIHAYRLRDAAGGRDEITLELLRGAVRVVTGLMVSRSPAAFTLRGPQAELKLAEPADFSVALVNPMYVVVHSGSVVATNAAGAATVAEGATVSIAGPGAAPAAASLPQATAGAFGKLQAASLASPTAPGAASAGAATATGTAGTGFGVTGWVVVGGAAAAVAASSGSDEESASSTTHH